MLRSAFIAVGLLFLLGAIVGPASAGYLSTETDRCGRTSFEVKDRWGNRVPIPPYQKGPMIPVTSNEIRWYCGLPSGWLPT